MDEALILERLDNLSNEIRSMKSSVLDDLKQEILPVIQQASPRVMEYLSDLDGHYNNEDLAHLVKNLLMNVQNLNSMLNTMKAGMELKEDLGPVVKQALPRATDFFAELDGQMDTEELGALVRNTLGNLHHLNSAVGMLKSGMELKEDLGPVVQQTLPKAIDFFAEVGENLDTAELNTLIRKTLANLQNFNSALDMLKSGVEFKEDLGPVIQMALPKIQNFMADLHEGEFQGEQLGNLMKTFLLNAQTFSELMDQIKPMTEFVNEVKVIVRQVDVFGKMNTTLDELESCGLMRLTRTMKASFDEIDCSSDQINEMCEAIADIDLSKAEPVGPFGAYRNLKDPKVQKAMGVGFMMLRTMGTLLETYKKGDGPKDA